ncbi:MAG: ExbD/TolR family protein, partial [bacterium]
MMDDDIFSRRDSDPPSMGITMAPLIDVVFLLLIFFMVTTTFQIKPGLNVELPRSGGKTDVPNKRWVITMTEEGQIYLNENPASLSKIQKTISNKNRPVIL